MDKIIEILNKSEWYKHQDIKSLDTIIGLYNFPGDYLEFLKQNNCGTGYIGENDLFLWKINWLKQLNEIYQIQEYLGENCFGFGTIGDKCCCFDNNNGNKIIKCELDDLDYNKTKIIADTFYEFIIKLDKEKIE